MRKVFNYLRMDVIAVDTDWAVELRTAVVCTVSATFALFTVIVEFHNTS